MRRWIDEWSTALRLGGKHEVPPPGEDGKTVHRTIMVVESDPGTQSLLKRALNPLGCHLVVAQSGSEALKRLRQTVPNLFIVALSLPQMNGWEFIQKLKDDSGFEAIPVIVLSAHGGFWDKVVTRRAMKVRTYLQKPFNADELRDAVRKELRIKLKG